MNKFLSQRGAALGGVVATLTASIALGAAGSVAVYRVVAGPSVTTPALAQPAAEEAQEPTPTQAAKVKPKVKWAPCKPPAVLEKGVCVTDVVKTVVVPPVAAAQVRAVPAAGSGEPARAAGGNDDRRERDDDRRDRDDDRDDDRRDRDDDRDDDRDEDDERDDDREDHEDEDHEDEDDD